MLLWSVSAWNNHMNFQDVVLSEGEKVELSRHVNWLAPLLRFKSCTMFNRAGTPRGQKGDDLSRKTQRAREVITSPTKENVFLRQNTRLS